MKFKSIYNIIAITSLTIVASGSAAEGQQQHGAAQNFVLVPPAQDGGGSFPVVPASSHSSALTIHPQQQQQGFPQVLPHPYGTVGSDSYSVTQSLVVRKGDAVHQHGANQTDPTGTQVTQKQYQGVLDALAGQTEAKRTLEGQLTEEQRVKQALETDLSTEREGHAKTKAQLAKSSNPSLIGTACGALNYIMCGCLDVPKNFSEPACTALALILSAAMDHKDGAAPIAIVGRALVSIISCRGTIEIGNTLDLESKIKVLRQKGESSAKEESDTEDTQKAQETTKKSKKKK